MGWLDEERRARKRLEREKKDMEAKSMKNAVFTAKTFMERLRARGVYKTLVNSAEPLVPPTVSDKTFAQFINSRADVAEPCPLTGEPSTYRRNVENINTILRMSNAHYDYSFDQRYSNDTVFYLCIGDAGISLAWTGFVSILSRYDVRVFAGDYDAKWSVVYTRGGGTVCRAPDSDSVEAGILLSQEEADHIVSVVRNVEQRRIDLDTCTMFVNIVAMFYYFTADMVRDFRLIGEMFDEFEVDYAKRSVSPRGAARTHNTISDPHTRTTLLMIESKIVRPAFTRLRALRTVLNSDAPTLMNNIRTNDSVRDMGVYRNDTLIDSFGHVSRHHRFNALSQHILAFLQNTTIAEAETFLL